MSHDTVQMYGPENKYGSDQLQVLRFRDKEHVPTNKRRYECESLGILEVVQHIEQTYLTIELTEITTPSGSDKTSSREISMTINREMAERLAKFILECR